MAGEMKRKETPEMRPADSAMKFSDLIRESPYKSLELLKANPTIENAREYAKLLKNVRLEEIQADSKVDFLRQALAIVLPILASDLALQDARSSALDDNILMNKYGKYKTRQPGYKNNDCFTYVFKLYYEKYFEILNSIYDNSANGMSKDQLKEELLCIKYNPKQTGTENGQNKAPEKMAALLGEKWAVRVPINLWQATKLHLQPGDLIKVNHSPYGPGNHWGIVAEENGKLYIVGRYKGADKQELSEFFKHSSGGTVEVTRLGDPKYSDHFEIALSKKGKKYEYAATLVKEKAPDLFVEKSEFTK